MNDKVLFVIPAYNEEKNIHKLTNDIKANFSGADILIVNDHSNDNTIDVLKNIKINYLELPVNLGYSGAVQTGIKYANRNNYDYVIQFDGDGQHLACEAGKLYDRIKNSDLNIVIGSRFLNKKNIGYNHPFFRKLGTGLFTFIIKLMTGVKITDPTSGMQILDKKVIYRYSQAGEYPEFPDANLIAKMILEGYRVDEIPCIMAERTNGISMHAGILNPIKYMIKTIYSLLLINVGRMTGKKKSEKNDK